MFVFCLKILKLIKESRLCNDHYPSILVTSFGETEHFSLLGKQKHNVQKPIPSVIHSTKIV